MRTVPDMSGSSGIGHSVVVLTLEKTELRTLLILFGGLQSGVAHLWLSQLWPTLRHTADMDAHRVLS